MSSSVAVYTSVTAGYDALNRVPVGIDGVDFIAFVDQPHDAVRAGWEPRPLPKEVADLSPRMRAKWPKLLPHRALPEYPVTFWIDASHQIRSATFVDEALPFAQDTGFALHRHPWRDCIYDEAVASLELWKYASQPIEEQVNAYRRNGHPEHWGLWACGSMLRMAGIAELDKAMEAWWLECLDWSYQDQLSLPPVLRAFDLKPTVFPHHQVFENPWFQILNHPRNNE